MDVIYLAIIAVFVDRRSCAAGRGGLRRPDCAAVRVAPRPPRVAGVAVGVACPRRAAQNAQAGKASEVHQAWF